MNFVIDVSNTGAKGKPFSLDLGELVEEIDVSYDEIGVHERLAGSVIPYIDYDSFAPEDTRVSTAKKIVKAIRTVFGDNVNILLVSEIQLPADEQATPISI